MCGAPKHTHLGTKTAIKSVFGYLAWVCLKCPLPPKTLFLVWHAEHTYLCSGIANETVFGCVAWMCLKCTLPNVCFWCGAPNTHISAPTLHCCSMPSVFGMHNAKQWVFLVWRAGRTYLCTTGAINIVFGYLVWVCLECTMPNNVCFWCSTPNIPKVLVYLTCDQDCLWIPSMGVFQMRTHIPLHQKCDQECIWIPSVGVFEPPHAKKCVFLDGARRKHILLHQKGDQECLWIPSMGRQCCWDCCW